MRDVDAADFHLDHLTALGGASFRTGGRLIRGEYFDVRFPEDDEEVVAAGVGNVVGHVEIRVHARLEDGNAAELVELRGLCVVVEGAGNEDIEARVAGFPGGDDKVGTAHGAELRANEDVRSALRPLTVVAGLTLDVVALRGNELAGPTANGGEGDLVFLVFLLHPALLEVLNHDLSNVGFLFAARAIGRCARIPLR